MMFTLVRLVKFLVRKSANAGQFLLFFLLAIAMPDFAQSVVPIDAKVAHAYVEAYAKKMGDRLEYGSSAPDGSFGGLVSNVRLDFDTAHHAFIVRAVIEPSLRSVERRQDVWERLQKIQREQAAELDYAVFEHARGLIPFSPDPGLFLRRDFTDGRLSPGEMARIIESLSKTAYFLHRSKLGQVAEEANAARKAQQK